MGKKYKRDIYNEIFFLLQSIDKSKAKMMIHVYTLNTEGAASEEIEEEEDISAANHWILPSSNNLLLIILLPVWK